MDYSKLSDFEINQRVGDMALNGRWACKPGSAGNETNNWQYGSGDPSLSLSSLPDYCNNPADAWPIISANRISIEYDSEDQCDVPAEWVTAYGIDDLKVHVVAHQPCDKALRSAMIVFLMMQELPNVPANSTGSDLR
ncbi:protein ninX [Enterobacter cloacae]|uniref:phage protein NinX family protein n=1 Tax=Enterobacter cloacae TaxID=550 RepID=UPI00101240E9|nr:phage protein NinX family protein [Enterobacter cloacae]RXX44459.1 protein ninX [Enterobacter cloacae]